MLTGKTLLKDCSTTAWVPLPRKPCSICISRLCLPKRQKTKQGRASKSMGNVQNVRHSFYCVSVLPSLHLCCSLYAVNIFPSTSPAPLSSFKSPLTHCSLLNFLWSNEILPHLLYQQFRSPYYF